MSPSLSPARDWGGVLANPATLLAHAWASMVDAHGRILVPELRPQGVPADVRAVLRDVPMGGAPDDPRLDADWGEPGLSPIERLVAWNTLEILAMESGAPARPINAIPRARSCTGNCASWSARRGRTSPPSCAATSTPPASAGFRWK